MTLSSGASVAYTHQLNEDLTGLVNTFVGSSLALTYGFNKVHQITSDLLSDGTYTWHPASPGSVSYTTANNVNEYPQVGAASFSYNTNACLIGDGIWTHGYDTENHLLASAKSGTSLTYVYDPFHRQIQKTVTTGSTVKTRYVYSGWHRMADYDGVSGTLQNRYVYGETFDEPLIQVTGAGALTFLHANHQGTIVATTNSSGTVTNKIVTGPFGETITIGDTTFGYNGQRYDSETGLYYYKNRYYSPTLGRFLQPDPIGYQIDEECGCACPGGCDDASTPSTLNLYTYVDNDPLNQTDPLGLQVATMAGTAVAPGPGTAVGIAIDVGIALGLGALAIGIGQAAADAAEPYWRRLKRKICEANAFGNLNNCLDEAATFPCPEDAAQYRDICWRLWEAQVAKC